MALPVISSRADLDAIAGTPEHAQFMQILAGSLWRLEKDDAAQTWRAVEDDSVVARYGFTRADLPNALAPDLPADVPPPSDVPQTVTMRQARLALLGAGLLAQVNAAIEAMPGAEGEAARIEWEYAQEARRDSLLVSGLAAALGLTDAQLDALFTTGAGL